LSPLRAVVFDLWNTLVTDTPELGRERERARLEGLARALAEAGVSYNPAEIERAYHEAAEELRRLQSEGRDLPSLERSAFFLHRLDPELSAGGRPELLAAVGRSTIEAARCFPPVLLAGAVEALEDVRRGGRLTGLISNTGATPGPALRPVLEGYGLLPLLDVATFSDEAGECKPTPGIFHRTLSALGVRPEEAVFVGDTPELDVAGPQRVGMWTVQVGEMARDVPPHAPSRCSASCRRRCAPWDFRNQELGTWNKDPGAKLLFLVAPATESFADRDPPAALRVTETLASPPFGPARQAGWPFADAVGPVVYSGAEYSEADAPMAKKKGSLSTPEYAVLGLLRQPMHGYQVAREMAEGGGLGLVCPLGMSNVYFLLGNLQERGLVAVAERQEERYPPRVMLHATAAGRRAFDAWLREPVTRLRQVRLDFLVKLFFLDREDLALARDLVEVHKDFCRRYLAEWRDLAQKADSTGFDRLAIEAMIAVGEGTLRWLEQYERSLGD
jgi:putative hydrolase of the HAD superfamily